MKIKNRLFGFGEKTLIKATDKDAIGGVLTIPEGVVEISAGSVQTDSCKKVIFPKSTKQFYSSPFKSYNKIEEIEIHGQLESLNINNMKLCNALRSIYISSVKTLGDFCFNEKKHLNKVVVDNGLEEIGESCFCDADSLTEFNIPKTVKTIGDYAFLRCYALKEINLPQGLEKLGVACFAKCRSIESVTIPKSVKVVPYYCFSECTKLKEVKLQEGIEEIGYAFVNSGLKKIEIPESVKVLDNTFNKTYHIESIVIKGKPRLAGYTFLCCEELKFLSFEKGIESVDHYDAIDLTGCDKLKFVLYRGKKVELTDNIIKRNFYYATRFHDYAIDNNLFVPKNSFILTNTKESDIPKYYKHAKEWKELRNKYIENIKLYLGIHGEDFKAQLSNPYSTLNNAVNGLYQACIILGFFEEGKNKEEADEFINKYLIEMAPLSLHAIFDGLDTFENGYNEEFAKFVIKNYHKPKLDDRKEYVPFMHVFDEDEYEYINYMSMAYNNWEDVKEAYPNKTVIAHREQGSENNNITVEDVINALLITEYDNVHEGNEDFVEMVNKYGYSQKEFEELQELYEKGKELKDKVVLTIKEDNAINGEKKAVTYTLLSKDDPEGLILGEKTNCCQTIDGAGKSCVEYGAKSLNSGFVKFSIGDRIVGQSWVWYNEDTKEICLDNIEIPTIWCKYFDKKQNAHSFVSCLKRLANSFKTDMEAKGHKVKTVTIGSGYNDLDAIHEFTRVNSSMSILPSDYHGYSDATQTKYIIPLERTKEQSDGGRE